MHTGAEDMKLRLALRSSSSPAGARSIPTPKTPSRSVPSDESTLQRSLISQWFSQTLLNPPPGAKLIYLRTRVRMP